MANPLNVYRGPDSVKSYFDPDSSPPLPLVEVPDCLNPYRQDGVRIYAKMMSMHPANNVKSMPGKHSPTTVVGSQLTTSNSVEPSREERQAWPNRNNHRIQFRIDRHLHVLGCSRVLWPTRCPSVPQQ